jgi:hypothetical protein
MPVLRISYSGEIKTAIQEAGEGEVNMDAATKAAYKRNVREYDRLLDIGARLRPGTTIFQDGICVVRYLPLVMPREAVGRYAENHSGTHFLAVVVDRNSSRHAMIVR